MRALLINCIPPDHVAGMVSYLRDFVDLPLGVYPNLGYYTDRGWRSDPGVGGAEYAELALRWREEGAQIIGGCCGVRPEHIAAARERLAGTRPATRARAPDAAREAPAAAARRPWTDARGRPLYPLPFPDLVVEPGVVPPGAAELHGVALPVPRRASAPAAAASTSAAAPASSASSSRCNHAAHVHCLDIDARAVANTLANAFRNGVSDRLTAAVVDLYPWVPEERYEVVVARPPQRPTDPFQPGAATGGGLLGPRRCSTS